MTVRLLICSFYLVNRYKQNPAGFLDATYHSELTSINRAFNDLISSSPNVTSKASCNVSTSNCTLNVDQIKIVGHQFLEKMRDRALIFSTHHHFANSIENCG